MAIALVQSAAFGNSGASGAINGPHSLPGTVTVGNLLIADLGARALGWDHADIESAWPSGWTTLVGNNFSGVESVGHVIKAKVVDNAADQSISFSLAITGSLVLSEWSGFSAAIPTVASSAGSDITDDDTPAIPAITPGDGKNVLLVASVWKKTAGPNPGPSTLSGYTLIDDSEYASLGNRQRLTSWYQVVASTSGTYGPTDISATGDASDDSNVLHAALENVAAPVPVADFTGTPNPAEVGETVTFTDLSTNTPTSWAWTFGDGDVSTSQNPTHVYATPGSYTVTLTATNAAGSDIETKAQYIVVQEVAGPGFWMDWVGDGFDSGGVTASDPRLARGLPQAAAVGTASGGDNVTDRVLSATWYRGASYDHVGQVGPGGFTILLDNFDGRYDPDNTASPLYGLVKPGVPVWAGAIAATGALGTANGTGTVAGFLAGYVREFVPTVRSDGKRVCEVIGEDAFGRYQNATVSVVPSLSRSYATFRGLILDSLGEDSTRRSLTSETGMLPFSAVDSANGLDVLEELNRATATRHFIQPADSKEDWYDYTTVNKLHKLQDAADAALTGDDISDISGWRVTNDNVIEVQRATVVPIGTTPDNAEVWRYEDVPFTVTNTASVTIWANFDDYVFNATVDTNVSAGAISATITNFGQSAKIELWATTGPATVGLLRVLGQQVTRGDSVTVVAGDQTAGARAGSTISSDYIGQTGAAQGLVDFLVWKFGQPLKRPAITVVGKNATTLSTIFDRDLFDVLTISVDKLSITTARRTEIIGLRGSVVPGASPVYTVTYDLQETPNQSAVDWFDVDTDSVNGSQVIAPF